MNHYAWLVPPNPPTATLADADADAAVDPE
jgi:hypothetical protein